MFDFVEERPDVKIQHPVHLLACDSDVERVQRIVLAPPWPESIRKTQKVLFPDLVLATKRVLAKKTEAEKPLKKLFFENQGQLNAALRLERTTRRTDISEIDFIHFYPYPPHYIDLCIGIMSGIRLQPGAPRHYGGSNRTIIKQSYEMLVSDRTAFAKKPIGALVTLDKVFELVEGTLKDAVMKRLDKFVHELKAEFPMLSAYDFTLNAVAPSGEPADVGIFN